MERNVFRAVMVGVKMKKIFLIFLTALVMSCQTIPIYKTTIPLFSCPAPVLLSFEFIDVETQTEEEIYLIRLNNMSKMERMIANLVHIIQCYEENLKQIREREE